MMEILATKDSASMMATVDHTASQNPIVSPSPSPTPSPSPSSTSSPTPSLNPSPTPSPSPSSTPSPSPSLTPSPTLTASQSVDNSPKVSPSLPVQSENHASFTLYDPPAWMARLGTVAIVDGQVVAKSSDGTIEIETALGKLNLQGDLAIADGASVRVLIRQVGNPTMAQITVVASGEELPPIYFNSEELAPNTNNSNEKVQSTYAPRLGLMDESNRAAKILFAQTALGDRLILTIKSMPKMPHYSISEMNEVVETSSIESAIARVAQVAQSGTKVSIPFLASLYVQSVKMQRAQNQNLPNPLQTELSSRVAVQQLVSVHAIHNSIEGEAGPVQILANNSQLRLGSDRHLSVAAIPLAQTGTDLVAEAAVELELPELLQSVQHGETHAAKLLGYFTSDGELIAYNHSDLEQKPPNLAAQTSQAKLEAGKTLDPAEKLAAITHENSQKMATIAQNHDLKSLMIARVVGKDGDGYGVVSIGSLLATVPQSFPSQDRLLLLAWESKLEPATNALMMGGVRQAVDAFDQLLQLAKNTGAMAPLAAVVPTIGPELAAQIAFYIGAVKGGDINRLISKVTREMVTTAAVAAGHTAIEKAEKAVAAMEQRSNLSSSSDWHSITVPLQFSGEGVAAIQPIILHYHGATSDTVEDTQKSKTGGAIGIRFMVDLTLSRLGTMQLDGLMREKRLSLVIRSTDSLSPQVKQELNHIFTKFLKVKTITGTLIFQVATPIIVPSATVNTKPGIVV